MAYFRCASGGGGSQPVLITKNITQNGTYNASADSADGYSQIKVEVSGGGATLGEKTISTYGVYNASDDSLDGYSKVTNVTGLETATASGGVASISDAVAMPCASAVANIDYNSQGVTEATLAKCGINLCDEDFEKGTLNNTTGLPENDNYNVRMKNYVPIRGGIQVYLYFGLNINLRYYWYDKDKTFISGSTGRNTILTVPANACYFKIRTTNNYGATYNHDISLNYPSTDTSYHAYDGATYTADFERTIYGGNYDFVSGVLTEDTDSNGDPISPPNVYNLTPQTITTAQGVNNFYSDTGDTAATYYREKPPLDVILEDGVVSDTSNYRTATFSDISGYSKIIITFKWESGEQINGVVYDVSAIGNGLNFGVSLQPINVYVNFYLTTTSIASTQYGGDFHNIYATIQGIE